jgi:hypothetical protein
LIRRLTLLSAAALCAIAATSWAQDKPKEGPQRGAPPQEVTEPCYAAYGLKPAEKIEVCSTAIQSGRLKGIQLALAYYNRATAQGNVGDMPSATSDYKEALRVFTE